MKNSVSNVIFILLVPGCTDHSINNMLNKKYQDSLVNKTVVLTEDFSNFFEKFNKDSVFQFSRIEFPLKFKSNEGKESVITINEWSYTKLIEEKVTKTVIRKKIISSNEVRIDFMEEDTGIFISHNFFLKSGKWLLVKIEDHSS